MIRSSVTPSAPPDDGVVVDVAVSDVPSTEASVALVVDGAPAGSVAPSAATVVGTPGSVEAGTLDDTPGPLDAADPGRAVPDAPAAPGPGDPGAFDAPPFEPLPAVVGAVAAGTVAGGDEVAGADVAGAVAAGGATRGGGFEPSENDQPWTLPALAVPLEAAPISL